MVTLKKQIKKYLGYSQLLKLSFVLGHIFLNINDRNKSTFQIGACGSGIDLDQSENDV